MTNNITHHPDINMLVEYSAGSLDWAVALAVSSHMHYCAKCKEQAKSLNRVGGHLLTASNTKPLNSDALERMLARVQQTISQPAPEKAAAAPRKTWSDPFLNNLPPAIDKALSSCRKFRWRRVSSSLKTFLLPTGQQKYEVAFQKITQGGQVVHHGHRGMEVTLVLEGSFSDEDGIYRQGDFLVRDAGETHRPTATQNSDCLCLSVLAAPVSVSGTLGKLVNPFLRFRPA